LQGQAGVAKLVGNGLDVFAFHVRQQTTDRGVRMLLGSLPLEGADKGFHKGVQTRQDLIEDLGCDLAFFKQLVFANGVPGVHRSAPSGFHPVY
jgi:hypothetical protein